MEFGVVLPQLSATWDQTLGAARKAEAAGFDSVWLVDHDEFAVRFRAEAPPGPG